MANSPSALKRVRQNEKRRVRRSAQRAQVRTALKKVRVLAEGEDSEAAQTAYRSASGVLDRMASKGTVAKGFAARNKSRLQALLKTRQSG